jgi:sugar phosphate isomerase/epimerase
MRFGIMAMQIDALVPSGLTPEGLLASIANFDHTNLVHNLASHGFKLIELGGDLVSFFPQSYSPGAIQNLARLKSEMELRYTVHLPLWSVEPSTPLTPVRQGSVQAIIETIRATQVLEPEIYVLHATGALAAEFYRMRIPESARGIILRLFQAGAHQSLKTILQETGLPSRQLAIETVEFPFELTLELADELDLSICLDTGHILVGFSGPIGLLEALSRCLPRLGEIHLHDGPWQGPEHRIGYGKDHRPLGTGDLEVSLLLDQLVISNFQGPIIFELNVLDALASRDLIRKIRPGLDPI